MAISARENDNRSLDRGDLDLSRNDLRVGQLIGARAAGGLRKIKRESCPFVNLPERGRGRWGQGITPAEMKRCLWVEPVLVAQIEFTEWTSDDQLRQPVFF